MTKKTDKKEKKPYRLVEKRSGRWSVTDLKGKHVNADAKVKILVAEGKIKMKTKKAVPAETP